MNKSDYQVKDEEIHLYHVRFTKILKEGKRTSDVYHYRTFSKKEMDVLQRSIKLTGLSAATQYDEMEIAHDPTKVIKEEPARNKGGRPPKQKEE